MWRRGCWRMPFSRKAADNSTKRSISVAARTGWRAVSPACSPFRGRRPGGRNDCRLAERGVYDELANEDVVDYLRRRETLVDLLLAADVLIYLGDLGICLLPSRRDYVAGAVRFSIEATDSCDYRLQASRRYAHSPNYIRRLAASHQWAESASEECSLRAQADGRRTASCSCTDEELDCIRGLPLSSPGSATSCRQRHAPQEGGRSPLSP